MSSISVGDEVRLINGNATYRIVSMDGPDAVIRRHGCDYLKKLADLTAVNKVEEGDIVRQRDRSGAWLVTRTMDGGRLAEVADGPLRQIVQTGNLVLITKAKSMATGRMSSDQPNLQNIPKGAPLYSSTDWIGTTVVDKDDPVATAESFVAASKAQLAEAKEKVAAQEKAAAEAKAAKEVQEARTAQLDYHKALAQATTLLLGEITHLDSGYGGTASPSQAKFRTELQPLAKLYGYKIVLVGDKSKACLVKL